MGYEKLSNYLGSLFPGSDTWLYIIAGIGVMLALARRNRVGTFLTIMAVLCAVVFRFAPQARLWNARVLPFWFLCLYLLAGVAFMEAGSVLVEHLRTPESRRGALIGVPIVTGVIAFGWVNYPLHNLPFGHMSASGKYSWMGISSYDSSFDPSWVNWNYSGYQSAGKAREQEYFALVAEMTKLGENPAYGCGRAMWEYEPELDQMGTPDALMLLPYWTHGCIGSQEGLYYESSATTPYHFLNAAELSDQPSNPVRGLNYPDAPDVTEGVAHLQMLGVKYFMAETPDIEAAADADSNLQLVATVGPYPVDLYLRFEVPRRTPDLENLRGGELGRGGSPRLSAGRDERRFQGRQAVAHRRPELVPQPVPLGRATRPRPVPRIGPGYQPLRRTCPVRRYRRCRSRTSTRGQSRSRSTSIRPVYRYSSKPRTSPTGA